MASAKRGVWEIRAEKIQKAISDLDAHLSAIRMIDTESSFCDRVRLDESCDMRMELDCADRMDDGEECGL